MLPEEPRVKYDLQITEGGRHQQVCRTLVGQVKSILNPCHHLLILLVIDFLCMCFGGRLPTCRKVSDELPLVVDIIIASA